jgi:hypothetical protein
VALVVVAAVLVVLVLLFSVTQKHFLVVTVSMFLRTQVS